MSDLETAARTLLRAWDENRARVGDLLVSEAVLAAVEALRAALPVQAERTEQMTVEAIETDADARDDVPLTEQFRIRSRAQDQDTGEILEFEFVARWDRDLSGAMGTRAGAAMMAGIGALLEDADPEYQEAFRAELAAWLAARKGRGPHRVHFKEDGTIREGIPSRLRVVPVRAVKR